MSEFEKEFKSKNWDVAKSIGNQSETKDVKIFERQVGKNLFMTKRAFYNDGPNTIYYATTIEKEHTQFKIDIKANGFVFNKNEELDGSAFDFYVKENTIVKLSTKIKEIQSMESYSIQISTFTEKAR